MNLSDIVNNINKNTAYSLTINDKLYVSNEAIGSNFPYINYEYDYKLEKKNEGTIKLLTQLSLWNIEKIYQVKRASEITWDVETMVNNKNLLKFDFKGTDIDEIELYLYDVNKNKVTVNYTHPVTDEDRTRGYKFIQVDNSFDLSNKVTLIYRSIAKDKGDIHFIPSKVKCETRTTQIKEEYNTKLKVRFRLKSIRI